jgi:GTPase
MTHKSGFVNIVGRPNVGKSTLINQLVGEKLAIITHKAQTTRHRLLGIINDENHQIILSDTPGILDPAYQLQEKMMHFVDEAFSDADVLLYMVELGEKVPTDNAFFEKFRKTETKKLLLLNKIDLSDSKRMDEMVEYWHSLLPEIEILPISAKENVGIDLILAKIKSILPESPPYYPKDTLTEKPQRFFVNEKIREKILLHYQKEIPYSTEIVTESFMETEEKIEIESIIFVERESQKGIIIGHKGSGLSKIGKEARIELQKFFDKKIYLHLYVKVKKDWRKNEKFLKQFGY